MKFFLLSIFSMITIYSFSQKTLRVEYQQERVGEKIVSPISINGVRQTFDIEMPRVRMLLNDSIAQIHYFLRGYDPLKKKTSELGDKLIHHGSFYDFAKREFYSQCNLDKTLKYLIPIDTTQFKNWSFFDAEKTILGHKCRMALSINEKNDSTLVWFTNEFNISNGFLFYFGVPGLVLEAYDQRFNSTMHFLAVKVQESDIKLLRPQEGKVIAQKEFSEIIKKRNGKMGGDIFTITKRINFY